MKPTAKPRRLRKGITVYVVRNADGEFLPAHVVPDDCEIIATVTPPSGMQSESENASYFPAQKARF